MNIEYREYAPMERNEQPFSELADDDFPCVKQIKHVVKVKTESEIEQAAKELVKEGIWFDMEEALEKEEAANDTKRYSILKSAIKMYGAVAQSDMMIEEMSELAKAILKYRRALCAGELTERHKDDVIEEMADVQIMLDQMKIIYGQCAAHEIIKLNRLAQRMNL